MATAETETRKGRSLPFDPGEHVRVGGLDGLFEVVSFDGSLYRLRSDSGAELKAGRRIVRSYRFAKPTAPR